MPRSPAELRAAARAASFTPSAADVPALVSLAVATDEEVDVARALGRQAEAAIAAARAALDGAVAPARARLVRLLDRLGAPAAIFVGLAADADPKASRVALVALGKRPGGETEAALLAAIRAPRSPAHLRAAVDALGKIGGGAAREALGGLGAGDADLDRVAARAKLRVERSLVRDAPSAVDPDATVRAPILFRCREGLERLLGAELAMPAAGPGRVRGIWKGRLGDVFRARLFVDFGFIVPVAGKDVAAALAGALPLLRATTIGAIRYRLAFAGGGHRRAEVQRLAAADRRPRARARERSDGIDVGGRRRRARPPPRAPAASRIPRFAYRVGDVPAASHPTLAAALARVGRRAPRRRRLGSVLRLRHRARRARPPRPRPRPRRHRPRSSRARRRAREPRRRRRRRRPPRSATSSTRRRPG